jgi:hypothetical protein
MQNMVCPRQSADQIIAGFRRATIHKFLIYQPLMTSLTITSPTSARLANSRLKVDESSQSYGRGLIATESVPPGSLLLRLDPLISVLEGALLDKACSACFTPSKAVGEVNGKDLLKCAGCAHLRYCSKVMSSLAVLMKRCQRKDWKSHHAKECKYLKLSRECPPILIRGVMRLVHLYSGDETNLGFAGDVANLLSHMEELRKTNRFEVVEQLSEGINRRTTIVGGRPLTEDGFRGLQQLICKVIHPPRTADGVPHQFDDSGIFEFRSDWDDL